MLIYHATQSDIERAAHQARVQLLNLRAVTQAKRTWRVRLVPLVVATKGRETLYAWQRYSSSAFPTKGGRRRKVHAVCWHGHRAFMRALYALAPTAKIRTAFATYYDAAHFERNHGDTAYRTVGPAIARVQFGELCACGFGRDILARTAKTM